MASIAFGASVIEKHFTLSRSDGGVDSNFSLEPGELASLVIETYRGWEAIGEIHYGPTKAEKNSLIFRRSIYVIKDIKEGEMFSAQNLKIVRPGDGAPPSLYDQLIGKKSRQAFTAGSPLHLDLLI